MDRIHAANPGQFKPSEQKTLQKIAYKYYDAWIYLRAISKSKSFRYIYILESPDGDSVSRKAIRNKITDLLPFELQKLPEIKKKMISSFSFEVLSIDEWNSHNQYKLFSISQVTA